MFRLVFNRHRDSTRLVANLSLSLFYTKIVNYVDSIMLGSVCPTHKLMLFVQQDRIRSETAEIRPDETPKGHSQELHTEPATRLEWCEGRNKKIMLERRFASSSSPNLETTMPNVLEIDMFLSSKRSLLAYAPSAL